jgi:hypothetical protein
MKGKVSEKRRYIHHTISENYVVLLRAESRNACGVFYSNPVPFISVAPFKLMILGYCTNGFLTALIYSHVQQKIAPSQNNITTFL